ncbi:hypothetical protein GCM10022403_034390 [Streptomyces coacervatus]|uniref:Uncharacterized protein n=1 Tax=Streptomyces coacervatus TaxID=647381 RepID=A0ABP7HKF3_9ACTN|nr:hypothetical protein [Streptomyces coacervatus]MDF2272086.1 hypothetical protein [Streptomyces coacervatus]
MLFLDDYERRARLVPGLLAILPLIVLFAVLGLRQIPAVSYAIGTLALAGAGPVLIAGAVRNFGRAVEQQLWDSWGGPPTIAWLRLDAPSDDEAQRQLWRRAVEAVSGVALPSLRAERRDKAKADNAIKLAIKRVRDRTRDKERFALLFNENRNYGYERNIYGLRWPARGIGLLSALALASYMMWLAPVIDRPQISAGNLFGLTACLLCLIGWFLLPSSKRVQDAANRYAHELLHAAVTLQDEAQAPDPTSTVP